MTRVHGLLEGAASPPGRHRLDLAGVTTPAGLSRAVIAATWQWVLGGSTLVVLVGLARTLVPVLLGQILDAVVAPAAAGADAERTWRSFAMFAAMLVGLYLVVIVGDRLGGRIGWYGMQRAQFELSQLALGRCLAGKLNRLLPGEFVSRLTADVRQTCEVLYVLVYPPGEVVQLVTTTVVLWSIDPVLALAVPIGAPVVLFAMQWVARPLEDRIAEELESLGETAGSAADTLAGYRVLQGLGAEEEAAARYRKVSRRTLRAALAARSAEARFSGIMDLAGGVFSVLLIGFAVHRALQGEVTVGELVTVAGLGLTVVSSLDLIIDAVLGAWASAQGGGRRLLDLMAVPGGDDRDEASEPLPVVPGEFVVVTGPTPTVRLADGGGEGQVLVVPREAQLLTGTVLENVMLSGADRGVAERMLERAGLAAEELAEGYDTDCGDHGSSLSGGQRQRIALARALATGAETMVLSHPTSSVDAATEQRIAVALRQEREGRTTVVVTDSPAFRAVATRVLGERR